MIKIISYEVGSGSFVVCREKDPDPDQVFSLGSDPYPVFLDIRILTKVNSTQIRNTALERVRGGIFMNVVKQIFYNVIAYGVGIL